MRLDAWLRQQHSPAERLRLVEQLAQAINVLHQKGEVLASLAPERVEVGNDFKVDLGPAERGRPEPGYAAPEVLEGAALSTAADIYSAGALCWEILAGRPCGESPKPLLEVVPDLPRELGNSVMGCLEKSPDWRPKDLTYLAQLAAAQQRVGRPVEPAPATSPSPRPAPMPKPSQSARLSPNAVPRRESRGPLPLILAAVLLVAAAAASYFWLGRDSSKPTASVPRPVSTPTPAATPLAMPEPVASATPAPLAAAATPTPTPAPKATATPTPAAAQARPAPTAEPVAVAVATPVPTPPPVAAAPAAPASAPVAAVEPPSLATLSPLVAKRGGRVLLDLRGSGLRADQHVQILPLKDPPRGITVIRQKWTNANLVSVLLELDANVSPTAYAIALESANGERTNPLHFTVTK
jgi:serine/threonine-protein kinase